MNYGLSLVHSFGWLIYYISMGYIHLRTVNVCMYSFRSVLVELGARKSWNNK